MGEEDARRYRYSILTGQGIVTEWDKPEYNQNCEAHTLVPIVQETELLRGLNDFCEKPMVISQQESNGEPGQSGNWKLRPKTMLVVAVTIGMMDIM
ncbi:hypothetical protein HCDG_08744 [Histoplasma capsulatum H143]|uniref:Uncharacterized protein n=1 Tax=Ajellomyces capsulatus (strain H143) TaxID=544712 RepID=C6HQS2_AJECH|nr:hypothetical protein HCDG_08744 [Histoplasma capsulatum H143]